MSNVFPVQKHIEINVISIVNGCRHL